MKDEPTIILRRTRQGLSPVSAIDEEALSEYALGSDLEVVIRKRRSGPQQRLYWAVLGDVVKATGIKWPTAKHLHSDLKISLGYWEKHVTMSGQTVFRENSTAFQKMDGAEFKVYFDRAIKLIIETCGFDPLADYEQRKAS